MNTVPVGDHELVAAVHAGDSQAVFELSHTVDRAKLAGAFGSELLEVAAVAGHSEVVRHLVGAGADPRRRWDGDVDPVFWAVEHGAYHTFFVLWEGGREGAALLETARAWAGLDHETELRRRLGVLGDDSALVEREVVQSHEYNHKSSRVRVTTSDGRRAEVETGHLAIVTELEAKLGIRTSADELFARALVHPDPDYCDWGVPNFVLMRRADDETLTWAAEAMRDTAVHKRLFAGQVLSMMGYEEHPLANQAIRVLKDRLRFEDNVEVLGWVIRSLANFADDLADRCEILLHRKHNDPQIRLSVTSRLGSWTTDESPEALAALKELASDQDGAVRACALHNLAESTLDTNELREIMAAHLADTDPHAALEAIVGLALRHDDRGLEPLDRMAEKVDLKSLFGQRIDIVQRRLAYATKPA